MGRQSGIVNSTKGLALDLADRRIQVKSVAPVRCGHR